MTHGQSPFASVIIPVFNDVERLKICLGALEKQSYPHHLYETIVVDNGSDADLGLAGIVADFRHAVTTFEPIPGSYAARNRGISVAKGSILAFTDADCIPSANWLERGVMTLLKSPNCGFVAGKLSVFFRDPDRPTAVELYESLLALPQEDFLTNSHFGATANLLTLRTVVDTIGQFDARLKSSGDLEWGQRVHANGYQQIYAEDVLVAHPARHSFSELYLRTVRIAGGQYDLIGQTASPFRRNLRFYTSLIRDMIPPVMFIGTTLSNPRLTGIVAKLKVAIAIVFVRYVSAWEKLRLRCGGISSR